MAHPLQYRQAAQRIGPPPACARKHRSDGPEAYDALTIKLDHLMGACQAIDRTLNGYCDWVEALAPEPVDLAPEGGATLKAAQIPVILYYSSEDPLK